MLKSLKRIRNVSVLIMIIVLILRRFFRELFSNDFYNYSLYVGEIALISFISIEVYLFIKRKYAKKTNTNTL